MTSNTNEKSSAVEWVLSLMEAGEQKGVHALLHEVTPARAQALLDQNPDNRNVKPSKIDQYGKDMAEGRYEGDNGETVILAKTGELNDGQNRLNAIVKTGIMQKLLIAVGVRRESRKTVDVGANRSAGDYLKMSGDRYGNVTAAAARRVHAFKTTGNPATTGRISTPESVQLGESDDKLKEASAWASSHAGKFRILKLPASELAFFRYMFEQVAPKGEWKGFFNALGTGINLTETSPILALRNKLLRPDHKFNLAQRAELVIKAWNAWIRDETNTTFQINGKIPEVKGPKRNRQPVEEVPAQSNLPLSPEPVASAPVAQTGSRISAMRASRKAGLSSQRRVGRRK